MFGIFKKKEPQVATIEEVVAEEKTEELLEEVEVAVQEPKSKAKKKRVKALSNPKYDNTAIGELHNRFYTSSDKLLKESKQFMKNRGKELKYWEKKEIDNTDKALDLKALGFTNAGQTIQFDKDREEKAEEIKQARIEIAEKTELANAVEYFKITYPKYKFITLDNIKVICEKYGLVFGKNELFTGFVPIPNLEDIKAFWKWKDLKTKGIKMEDRCFKNDGSWSKKRTFVPYKKIRDEKWNEELEYIKENYPEHYDSENAMHTYNWEQSLHRLFGFRKYEAHKTAKESEDGNKDNIITYQMFVDAKMEKECGTFEKLFGTNSYHTPDSMDELYIAAPIEDMNMKGQEVVDFEVVEQIDDPVVFYPVSHGDIVGGLIITAWGDEASDPLVMDEKLN